MKKIVILICLITLFLVMYCFTNAADEKINYLVKRSIEINNNNINILKINPKKYNYEAIHQYCMVDSIFLYVLGTSLEGHLSMSMISLKDGNSTIIRNYTEEIDWAANESMFYLLNPMKMNSTWPILIVEYTGGNVARIIDQREKIIDIYCYFDDHFQILNSEKVSGNNISYRIISDLKLKYFHLAFDESKKGNELIQPAKREIVDIYFSDLNDDSYPDIMLWKTVSFSRLITDKDKEDFIYDHEELSVMYFQPQEMKFSKPMPIKWQ